MSKLYIKQKVFSWKDRFSVQDEFGRDRYYAEGEILSLGKRLHVYDMTGTEVAYVQEKLWSFLPKYQIFLRGIQTAEVVKEFSLFRPRYTINGPSWECAGDFTEHNYEITTGGMPIVRIHKVWLSWGDAYELDIADDRDEPQALAVVLAIDAVLEKKEAASSASHSHSNSHSHTHTTVHTHHPKPSATPAPPRPGNHSRPATQLRPKAPSHPMPSARPKPPAKPGGPHSKPGPTSHSR